MNDADCRFQHIKLYCNFYRKEELNVEREKYKKGDTMEKKDAVSRAG